MYSDNINPGDIIIENFTVWCELPTIIGTFQMYDTGDENVRLVSFGDINDNKDQVPLVRIHSSCMASEIFKALDCDCSDQLMESMRLIKKNGGGLIIHLHQEGRGQGLSNKIAAISLMQEKNIDTVEAFDALNLEHDVRDYKKATDLLLKLGINQVRLITNNPSKVKYVENVGINVFETVNTYTNMREENIDYLWSKNRKLNHNIPLEDDSEKIYFHNEGLPFGFLSNFSKHPIYCKGKVWNTVEHYYQVQKFQDPIIQEEIRMAQTPILAKTIAHKNKEFVDKNWNSIKDEVMYDGLYAKFTQHPDINKQLKETGKMTLYEHSPNDSYWGNGGDGSGKNTLGNLLMKIREQLSDL